MKRVLLTGATGFIGGALTRALVARGDLVTALSRDVKSAKKALPRGVRVAQWDPNKKGPWYDEIDGVEAIVNLAGENVARRWTDKRRAAIDASRAGATDRLVEAIGAARHKPKVLVNASATGYYGTGRNDRVDEDAAAGKDELAKVCARWEGAAKKAEAHGTRVVLLRIGVVLGPGGALARMAPGRLFVAGPIGRGDNHVSWVHLDDVVGMTLMALDDESLSGPINCTSPYWTTGRELAEQTASVLGFGWLRRWGVPQAVAQIPLGEAVKVVTGDLKVFPQRAVDLGYEFHHAKLVPALEASLQRD